MQLSRNQLVKAGHVCDSTEKFCQRKTSLEKRTLLREGWSMLTEVQHKKKIMYFGDHSQTQMMQHADAVIQNIEQSLDNHPQIIKNRSTFGKALE